MDFPLLISLPTLLLNPSAILIFFPSPNCQLCLTEEWYYISEAHLFPWPRCLSGWICHDTGQTSNTSGRASRKGTRADIRFGTSCKHTHAKIKAQAIKDDVAHDINSPWPDTRHRPPHTHTANTAWKVCVREFVCACICLQSFWCIFHTRLRRVRVNLGHGRGQNVSRLKYIFSSCGWMWVLLPLPTALFFF